MTDSENENDQNDLDHFDHFPRTQKGLTPLCPEAWQKRLYLRAPGRAVYLRTGHAALGGREGCRCHAQHRAADAEKLAQTRTCYFDT